MDDFSPYLLGDSGYPLLPWLMTPHCHNQNLSIIESLYNKKLCRRRCVVKNAFGILKQSWRELLYKAELDVVYLPDVIICCTLLHNLLLGQGTADVERLLEVLTAEGWREDGEEGTIDGDIDLVITEHDVGERVEGKELQRQLGIYVATQRGLL